MVSHARLWRRQGCSLMSLNSPQSEMTGDLNIETLANRRLYLPVDGGNSGNGHSDFNV